MSNDESTQSRRQMEKTYEELSPFEFKNKLISLAEGNQKRKSANAMLNAGRGNPNWIAATPRQAFFTLGQFAVTESARVWHNHDLAGKPSQPGIADRFKAYAQQHTDAPGMHMLERVVNYGIDTLRFNPDEWLFELVDGIIGDNYPMPDRMLVHTEQMVHAFLVQEMCQGDTDGHQFDLFAVEGATAAMCYIFESLQANFLLNQGDKVAIMVPIFPPYVEIPHLHRYDFDVVGIHADGRNQDGSHTWQYPQSEIDKLKDPAIKALFLVNPSNPPSVAIAPEAVKQLVEIVEQHNRDLMIITDDVYSTFVDGFRSLMADLPYNTIGVYSFSKYFGVTGWRLGVVAVHEENVFDQLIQALPQEQTKALHARYESLSKHPDELKFTDRLVADSRQVALNHTAGLSTPQQVQMALFTGFALTDADNRYKDLTKAICRRRFHLLYEGLELDTPKVEYGSYYYTQFDLAEWANVKYGKEFTAYLQANYEPVDILFRLAERASIVLLNGGGFYGPPWSLRVSLANLDDDAYSQIGKELHKALEDYVDDWHKTQGT